MKQMNLIVGATGTVGTQIVRQLVDARWPVRVLVRDRAKAAAFGPDVDVAVGDLSRPETLGPAFDGVDAAFVAVTALPDLALLEANAFAAAAGARVRHVVKLSGSATLMSAGDRDPASMADAPGVAWHAESERRLRRLGLGWTILRPSSFASNIAVMWEAIVARGTWPLPAGDGTDAPIDPSDIAAVAVRALTTPGHHEKVYDLTGPEALRLADMMRKVAVVTGRSVRHEDASEAEAREWLMGLGLPRPLADTYLRYFTWGVREGRVRLSPTVSDLLGRAARSFDAWLSDHAAALR